MRWIRFYAEKEKSFLLLTEPTRNIYIYMCILMFVYVVGVYSLLTKCVFSAMLVLLEIISIFRST